MTSVAHVAALPGWARVTPRRREHIDRVTSLLARWADDLALADAERTAWRDAGLLHDALRDAPDDELRALAGRGDLPAETLHGPAVAERLARDGEMRVELLEAIRWHTFGNPEWGRLGRALYMADFLEPGRPFMREDRAFLAAHVRSDFDGVFRQVVRMRLEWTLREGKMLFPESVGLWNSVR